jgi:RNA polymerase sigma-54 factor
MAMAEQYFSQAQTMRQQQVLAPQLRQSLEMLQVPVLELRSLVQQEMERNPTLEETPEGEPTPPAPTMGELAGEGADSGSDAIPDRAEPPAPAPVVEEFDDRAAAGKEKADAAADDPGFKKEFEQLTQLDDEWRDYFQQNRSRQSYSSDEAARRQFFLDSLSQPSRCSST